MVKRFLATTMSVLYGFGGLFGHSDLAEIRIYNDAAYTTENVVYIEDEEQFTKITDSEEICTEDSYIEDIYSEDWYMDNSSVDIEWAEDMLELEEFECDAYPDVNRKMAVDRNALINSVPLKPMKTNDAEIDAKVQEILSQITNDSMTTYQKTEAIWNWIITNTYYQVDPGKWRQSYTSKYDTRTVAMSYSVLFRGYGSCANYAAAFVVMTRAIGLQSYLVGGKFVNRNGSKFDHYWANMKINGSLYTFDPQIEDNMWNKTGSVPKSFFCKTDDEVSTRYIYGDKYGGREDYIDGFNCFSLKGIVNDDKTIKGICQMPYYGEGGGYLIGVETYSNPNQEYQYELLILDCTLLAQGKDAWIYTTNKCNVSDGNSFWTVWQPQYGYYWTLFRVYDKNGYMLDEKCYGFQNIV